MERLILVHLSDLHFGDEMYPLLGSGNQKPTTPNTSKFLKNVPLVSAVYGHDLSALDHLEIRIDQLADDRNWGEDAKLVITGDLTAQGHDSEFALSQTYVRSRFATNRRVKFGLEQVLESDEILSVPGNHDHWEGKYPLKYLKAGSPGPNPDIYPEYFTASDGNSGWWWHRVEELDGLRVQLMGIDSSAENGNRTWARGKLDSNALDELEQCISEADEEANEEDVKVLAVHHSPSSEDNFLKFEDNSAQKLEEFCQNQGIDVLLTGHVHEPLIPGVCNPTDDTPIGFATELRTGTSVQGSPPGEGPDRGQCFLVHTIELADEPGWTSSWKVELFERSGTGDYIPTKIGKFRLL